MKQLQTFFIALVLGVNLSGCAFIPWQVSLLSGAADVGTKVVTGKTFTDHAISEAAQKDCDLSRLFSDWKVCLTHDEYVDNLIRMNCHTYSWNFLNIPYCRSSDE